MSTTRLLICLGFLLSLNVCSVKDPEYPDLDNLFASSRWSCTNSVSVDTVGSFFHVFEENGDGQVRGREYKWSVEGTRSVKMVAQVPTIGSRKAYSITDITFGSVNSANDIFRAIDSSDDSKLSCRKSNWASPQIIKSDISPHDTEADVAIDAEGNAMAVWNESDGTTRSNWASYKSAGTGWGVPHQLKTDSFSKPLQLPAKVAFDGSGNAIAIWSQSSGGLDEIWFSRFLKNVGWSTPAFVSNERVTVSPQLAVNTAGNAVVVWNSSSFKSESVWASHYQAEIGWSFRQAISGTGRREAGRPAEEVQIISDNTGNFMALWLQTVNGELELWSNRYIADTGWEEVTTLSRGDSIPGHARLAGDGQGNAVAIWNESEGTSSTVWSNRYRVYEGWSGPERIDSDLSGMTEFPLVAINSTGEAVAIWRHLEGDSDTHNLKANRYIPGTGWVGANTVNESALSSPTQTPPVITSAGESIVAWQSPTGVRIRRYTNSGWNEPESVANKGFGVDSIQLFIGDGGDIYSVVRQRFPNTTPKSSYSFQLTD